MGARSVATVVLSFGVTNIGLKLYLSASSEQVSFNMINPATGNRVRQVLVDESDYNDDASTITSAKVVSRSDTLKGYQYQKGSWITFTDEEVANMAADKKDTLDITEFVPVSEIDPLHVEKTFYTGPDKGFDKPYKVLYETLKAEGKAAVGVWVSRGKEHLIMIRAYQHGLIMHQMFYNTEVRSFEMSCGPVNVTPVDLALSKMLVDQFSRPAFDKSKYKDAFVERVTAAVETKLAGGEITSAVAAKPSSSSMADSLREGLLAAGVSAEEIDAKIALALKAVGAAVPEPVAEAPKKAKGRAKKAS